MLRQLIVIFLLIGLLHSCDRSEVHYAAIDAPFMQVQSQWADSMLLNMTTEEKIGQLLILEGDTGQEYFSDSLLAWTEAGMIGGMILSDLTVGAYLELLELAQKSSRIALLNGTKELAALNNQFSNAHPFPQPATISAINSDSVQQRLLSLYVQQCRALGINFSFAPSLSFVDANAASYDYQSYEQDPEKMLYRSALALDKIQKSGILAIGSTFKDLHYLDASEAKLQDSVLQKYHNLVTNGLSGLLVDNSIYKIDPFRFYPQNFLRKYLQRNLAFDGLVVADVTTDRSLTDLLYAGADLFLIDSLPQQYIQDVLTLIETDDFSIRELDKKVHKVLMAKTWLGIDKKKPAVNESYAMDLMLNDAYEYYTHRLYESAMILASNPGNLLPFEDLDRQYFKVVEINENPFYDFKYYFSKYANYNSYNYTIFRDSFVLEPLSERHLKTSTVVLLLDQIDLDPQRDRDFIRSVNQLSEVSKVALVNFGNPINLKHFNSNLASLQFFERNETTEGLAAQLLFGGAEAKGHLPIALADHLPFGAHTTTEVNRLKYTLPQELGIDKTALLKIDDIVEKAIRRKAMPGCQVMVVKDGKVFYDKSFGYHTYDKKQEVRSTDLYDLASVSKVAGTTLAGMKLYEKGHFKLENSIADYLIGTKRPRVRRVSVRELFTHRSGLQSYMPIAKYIKTRYNGAKDCNKYFCNISTGNFSIPVGDDLFFDESWIEKIELEIHGLKVRKRGRYLYSDVNFNLIKQMIENTSKLPMKEYLDRQFYRPLNLRTMCYNPLERFPKSNIVPTARDQSWRYQTLRGYVHDESAALMGGVGGNAGLFSNANDLAILFQMLENDGSYGGEQLLDSITVSDFTKSRYGRRRALGFEIRTKKGTAACSNLASSKTYGHKGYTGACVWTDPDSKLTFIFLTNRIHPNPKNNKLKKYKVRKKMHDVVYRALDSYEESLQPNYDQEINIASKGSRRIGTRNPL